MSEWIVKEVVFLQAPALCFASCNFVLGLHSCLEDIGCPKRNNNFYSKKAVYSIYLSGRLGAPYHCPRSAHAGYTGTNRSLLLGHNALPLRRISGYLLHPVLHRHDKILVED